MNTRTGELSAIRIGRSSFMVEQYTYPDGRPGFILHGKRGATYGTVPYNHGPEYRMYLVNIGRGMTVDPLGPVTLYLDEDGQLCWTGATNR